ncbi:hypothetical protein EVJ20_07450 [Exiguobacterium sp. SH0S1]|uniref:dynamin family protein n=1 Tax=Exiguobacterium sp. SH0S1 TaxID=2510949 RepID=UPI0010403C86|nr:dynamin family protein [Exiguobacterium sp. SH0S1]TCI77787.1 hypothetical protein EVJ20_07450 [Exiguobacterium sp. SH0S1]
MIRNQFVERKQELQERFDAALQIGKELEGRYPEVLSVRPVMEDLQTLRENWENERFEIVVVGEFSTGKSTFINALLKREILPSKVTPTTATVNFIRHLNELGEDCKEPIAKVHFKNDDVIEIPYRDLPDYVTEMSEKVNVSENIRYVDLYVDSPYLENGVVLVDTPGLQALNIEHERITKEQIKKSNASILLFNMEQPGKLTEIKFLRDLSESIDRIFFVANRLDGVPYDQVQEVKEQLEKSLRENDYQQIAPAQAIVYPVSALQALKAQDELVVTKHWEDVPADELMTSSRFPAFLDRLENYLFAGEKTKDFLNVPYVSIENYYEQLIRQLEQYKEALERDDDMEELEKAHKLAKDEAELRNLQLKKEVIRLKNLFSNTKRENEKQFNEEFEQLTTAAKLAVGAIESFDRLESQVNDELELFNKDYQALFDRKLFDLAEELNTAMRHELEEFELKLETPHLDEVLDVRIDIHRPRAKTAEEIEAEVKKQFADKKEELADEKRKLDLKTKQEHQLSVQRRELQRKEGHHKDDLRFYDMMINSTPQTEERYGVIKKRRFWFDKHGTVKEENKRYDQLIAQRREEVVAARRGIDERTEQNMHIEMELGNFDGVYADRDEILEEQKALNEKEGMALIRRMNEELAETGRLLSNQKRKVTRQLDSTFTQCKRDYRDFIRTLDTLKLAEQQIEEYIRKQDELLSSSIRLAAQLAEQIDSSQETRASVAQDVETVKQRVEEEKMLLMTALI